jgi:hypothetical protein
MSRFLLALILLAAAVTAQAITPTRQGANSGGGTCPETETVIADAEDAPAQEPAPAATKTAPPPQAKGGTMARPKSGARWHSFLPGMFK